MDTIQIIGNLGRDPEMKYTPSGQVVTSFSAATTRKYKNKAGELVSETKWYRVEAWGNQAEACNTYLKKGSKVFVSGSLIADKNTGGPRTWEKKDGSTGTGFEIRANEIEFLSNKNDAAPAAKSEVADDDVPF